MFLLAASGNSSVLVGWAYDAYFLSVFGKKKICLWMTLEDKELVDGQKRLQVWYHVAPHSSEMRLLAREPGLPSCGIVSGRLWSAALVHLSLMQAKYLTGDFSRKENVSFSLEFGSGSPAICRLWGLAAASRGRGGSRGEAGRRERGARLSLNNHPFLGKPPSEGIPQ